MGDVGGVMPQASRSDRDLRGILRLYLVTDPELCSRHGLLETVRDAVRGGVSVVQLRDKTATTSALVEMGLDLAAVLADTGVPLVVNDNVEAAIAIGADGVHVGQGDMKVEEVRRLVGPDMILGLSCETVEDAIQAPADLVDYIGVSPVFATPTKTDHSLAVGIDGLRAIAAATPLPKVAIGGLKSLHFKAIFENGADGVAVVSAICGQPDVAAAASALSAEIARATAHRSSLER
jgi:thiamine-phosphate diphosphorylase